MSEKQDEQDAKEVMEPDFIGETEKMVDLLQESRKEKITAQVFHLRKPKKSCCFVRGGY